MGTAEALGGLPEDMFDRPFRIAQHVRIPQPNDPPTLCLKPCGALRVIIRLLGMLTTIQFYGQLRRSAGKIEDIGSDHQLPGKTRAIDRQQTPRRAFRIGRAGAKRASAFGHDLGNPTHVEA